MAKTILERAKRAYFRKQYNDVITLLEPSVIQYRDSFHFYYFLGMACLHTGDIGGASSYFQRARQIKMRDPDLLVAQAALFLRRGDTHQAVEYYLEALEYDPNHKLAKRSLDFIRKRGDVDTISSFVETGKIERFYPKVRKKVSPAAIAFAAAAVICCVPLSLYGMKILKGEPTGPVRADISALALNASERSSSVETGGSFRYVLTDRQVVAAYADAQKYFRTYRDNAAQVEINRIISSNASASIKQKARILMTYLAAPGFDSIKDNYSYSQVTGDAALYLDCWVVWKGMATNIAATADTLGFDLLVGYDTRSTLEGIVPVHFDTVLTVDPDKPLEVLAKISQVDGKIVLTGRSVFQSGKPAVSK
jgi:tetratricopeptide (TPR) repeat protein